MLMQPWKDFYDTLVPEYKRNNNIMSRRMTIVKNDCLTAILMKFTKAIYLSKTLVSIAFMNAFTYF